LSKFDHPTYALRAFAHRCKQNIIHTSSASRFGIADAHALFLQIVRFVGVNWGLHWVGLNWYLERQS
jgi:hypothetical protein